MGNLIKNDHFPFLNQKLCTKPCIWNKIYSSTN